MARSRSVRPRLTPVLTRSWLLAVAVLVSGLTLPVAASDTVFLAGTLNEQGQVVPPKANPTENAELGFFYIDPTSNPQGFSLALTFDCDLEGVEGSYDISGSFLVTVGAEFIQQDVDNDPGDGDGCELIIAVLLDFLPPFDNQTLPPTLQPLSLGTFLLFVPEDVPCMSTFPVIFTDGINGSGAVPINNTVVIENESVSPSGLVDTEIEVSADSQFVRGDSNNDTWIDIADIVFSLDYLFLGGPQPVCFDAMDADDDGKLTVTDPLYKALYIFLGGIAPPFPFPDCGLEPVPDRDELSCDGPVASCTFCP